MLKIFSACARRGTSSKKIDLSSKPRSLHFRSNLDGRVCICCSRGSSFAWVKRSSRSFPLDKWSSFYKSQLGLPDEDSFEFRKMTPENQEKVRKFCVTSAVQLASFLATYTAGSAVEEFARFIPFVGLAIAGGISFSSTYYFLHQCLNELEGSAVAFLDEMTTRAVDFDID